MDEKAHEKSLQRQVFPSMSAVHPRNLLLTLLSLLPGLLSILSSHVHVCSPNLKYLTGLYVNEHPLFDKKTIYYKIIIIDTRYDNIVFLGGKVYLLNCPF